MGAGQGFESSLRTKKIEKSAHTRHQIPAHNFTVPTFVPRRNAWFGGCLYIEISKGEHIRDAIVRAGNPDSKVGEEIKGT
jgi:hypothetical protein